MKICVYGLWHLGLVTTAGLLQAGHSVTGLDAFDLRELNKGIIPLYEKGVEDTLRRGLTNNTVSFTNDREIAFKDTDIVWVTFDTPVDERDNADIKYIETRIMEIIPYIQDKTRLIISSQVPVGFTERFEKMLLSQYPDKKIYIAYSPENLQLGNALERFVDPDRIIIGTHDKEQFEPFFKTISYNLIWMTIPSAEVTKHAINAYLAMSICFANEIAQICDSVGALSGEVEHGLKSDTRIGQKAYVRAGDVYSGGTLARDVKTLDYMTLDRSIPSPLLSSISESNYEHKQWIRTSILDKLYGTLDGKTIMLFGLTYKENTSTLRRSGPLELCEWLHKQGAIIYAHDPYIVSDKHLPEYIHFVDDLNNMPKECHCVIILKDPYPLISKSMVDMMIENTVVIDPNGYLQPKPNNTTYFSVRRLL